MARQRNATAPLKELLQTFRVGLLAGPRQSGKTTLINELLAYPPHSRISFDEPEFLRRARDDPAGFAGALPKPVAIDEFQRAGGDFLLAIKYLVDRDSTRGRVLLSGSANYLASRSVTETLAGRVGRQILWPFSQGEILGIQETFLDRLFDPDRWPGEVPSALTRADAMSLARIGGYPEIIAEGLRARQRSRWFSEYVAEAASREALQPIADVRREAELRKVLQLAAVRSSMEFSFSSIASEAQIGRETAANYIGLLEALYLIALLPSWSTNLSTRVKRRPKLFVTDSGLAASLAAWNERSVDVRYDTGTGGQLLETFVVTELMKQRSWSLHDADLYHFRDRKGAEVDVVVEDRQSNKVAGIEVKATASPNARHAKWLAIMRDRLRSRFTVGIVLHCGSRPLPLGERLWAMPISSLWRCDA